MEIKNRLDKDIFDFSSHKLESIYNTISVGIFRIRMTHTEVELLSVNPAVGEIFDMNGFEEFSDHWSCDGVVDTVVAEDYHLVDEGYRRLWGEDSNSSVVRYVIKDGSIRYLKVSNTVVSRTDDELLIQQEIANVTDNHKLIEKNEEIFRQQELMNNVYETLPNGILRLYADVPDELIMINPAGLKLLGASDIKDLERMRGNGQILGAIVDEDVKRLQARAKLKLKKQWDSFTMECRLGGDNERILSINTTLITPAGKRPIIQMICQDVTEEKSRQKRREQYRRERYLNQMFGVITSDTKEAYVLLSDDGRAVEFVSKNLKRLTGISDTDIREDMSVIFGEEEINAISDVTHSEPLTREIMRIHGNTGEECWVKDTFYRITLEKAEKILVVISDRTEELRVKQTLEDALENARIANRAKTDFLFDMSHDIRTPMTAISGLITLLQNDINDPQKAKKHLDQLEVSGRHMLELLNNILDMSRIESGKTVLNAEPFDIQKALDEVKTVYLNQADMKGIKVYEETEFESDTYIGDAVRLKKILLNLLSNAVKYTQSGGTVSLYAKSRGVNQSGYDTIRFVVKDTGIGMSPEFVEKLFVPFERETNSTTSGILGTGLGMSIVKNLVELMGGTVRVESKQGEGSAFTVDIPMKPVKKAESAAPAEKETRTSIEGLNLLIAEDNDMNAEILVTLLEMQGAKCTRAENGRVAVDLFEASEENEYDVILMDIQMPVMNGYEASKAIRSGNHPNAKTVPIAAMTANAFDEDVSNSIEAGMNAHISKPIKMANVKATICEIVK